MTKKQQTFYGVLCVLFGLVGGVISTAYTFGAEKQHIEDCIKNNTSKIQQIEDQSTTQLDSFTKAVEKLRDGIDEMKDTIGGLRSDIKVLEAIVLRIEQNNQ